MAPHQQLTLLAGSHFIACVVDHPQLVVRGQRCSLRVVHDLGWVTWSRVVQQTLGHAEHLLQTRRQRCADRSRVVCTQFCPTYL
jgi:hypothetical protein